MDHQVDIEGKKIFYRVTGEGRPVMLVHGFGEKGDVWEKQAEALQDQFRLIIPGLPGSGRSEMVDDMSMEGMAEILKLILDKEVLKLPDSPGAHSQKEISLLGHSMGGYITLAFLEKYPHYLRSYGLLHSSAFADSEEKKATRRKGIEFIKQHGAFEFLKTATPNLFSDFTKEHSPELVDQFIQSLADFSAEALTRYYESMMKRPDRTHILKNVKLPFLFITGEKDTVVPVADALKQSHLPERTSFHILQKSGHLGMLEEPGKMNELLRMFLTEL
jgi:pimeloyl-ACP methyl ester carboxylesterase